MYKSVQYNGARIDISQTGSVWQARVILAGTRSAHDFVPTASGPDGYATVLQQAKQLVDEVTRGDEIA